MQENLVKTVDPQTWAIYPAALDSIAKIVAGKGGDVEPEALVADTDREWHSYAQKIGSTTIIHVNGPIFYNLLYFGTNLKILTRDFQEALADKTCKQIILHFNTPGGVITGIAEFARMVYEARSKKKIIGYAQGMCASAGFWIFAACGICVADKTALLGSIGVVFRFEDDTEAMENRGYKQYVITSKQSPLKNISPADPKGEKAYQGLADELAAEFIDSVALYRNVTGEAVESDFGQGFIMTGEKAVKADMVDDTGTMAELLEGTLFINTLKGEAMAEEKNKPAEEGKETPAATEESETTETTQKPAASEATGEGVTKQIAGIEAQNEKMIGMMGKVLEKNETLTAENKELKEKNETLEAENEELGEQPDEEETPKANGMSDGIERGW